MATSRYRFDDEAFWDEVLPNELTSIFASVLPATDGRRDVQSIPNGLQFVVKPYEERSAQRLEATVNPTTGEIEFTLNPNQLQRGRLRWDSPTVREKINELMTPYIVDTKKEQAKESARALRGLSESSKSGDIDPRLPKDVQGKVLELLTGKKTNKSPTEVMKELKKEGEGGRRKTKRSSKKKRLTRRR